MELEKLTTQEWYQSLLNDLKKIAWTRFVELKHAIGKRILQDELKFGKPEYGSKRIENLAKDLKANSRDLYFCIQFARQYPEIEPAVQNLAWREIRKQLQEPRKETSIPVLPEGKYNVLLIDPPWTYRNIGVEGAVDNEYPTMTIEELCKMPIKDLIPENAVLFLWTTNPILEECFEVIRSWGFSYKTNFCWVKRNKKTGIGFYVRGIHELLLICIKGQMLPEYTPLSIIEADAKEHSRKPEIYDLIEKMYPNQKYLELFARNKEKRKNWTYWGNEALL